MSNIADITVSIKSHLPEAKEELKQALEMWAEMTGGELVNLTHRDKAEGGTPVDTGRLRNSMAYAIENDYKTVYVGTNVEYAESVEEGTRGKSGAHMLRNAVVDVSEFSEKALKEALEAQNI